MNKDANTYVRKTVKGKSRIQPEEEDEEAELEKLKAEMAI